MSCSCMSHKKDYQTFITALIDPEIWISIHLIRDSLKTKYMQNAKENQRCLNLLVGFQLQFEQDIPPPPPQY